MFASPEELRLFLHLSTIDLARADLVLAMASDAIRGDVGQVLDLVVNDVVLADGASSLVLLPELPVLAVTVTIGGVPLEDHAGYVWTRAGEVWLRGGAGWGWWPRSTQATITYTHGYDPLPPVLRVVALQVAARLWANPVQVASQGIGSTQFSGAPTVTLTDAERRMLDGLRTG